MPAHKKPKEQKLRPKAPSLWRDAYDRGALLFHHARPLEHCRFDTVVPVRLTQLLPYPESCPEPGQGHCQWDEWHDALHMEASYRWLSEQVGFWPLFLSVGDGDDVEVLRMTGYDNQFARILSKSRTETKYRAPGEFPSDVLFSFRHKPERARFSDFMNWHIPLNSVRELARHYRHCEVSEREARMVLRPSWSDADWMRQALKEPHSVQAVVPYLDLRQADLVRCRSQAARRELLARGFAPHRVEVFRLKVRPWWM